MLISWSRLVDYSWLRSSSCIWRRKHISLIRCSWCPSRNGLTMRWSILWRSMLSSKTLPIRTFSRGGKSRSRIRNLNMKLTSIRRARYWGRLWNHMSSISMIFQYFWISWCSTSCRTSSICYRRVCFASKRPCIRKRYWRRHWRAGKWISFSILKTHTSLLACLSSSSCNCLSRWFRTMCMSLLWSIRRVRYSKRKE